MTTALTTHDMTNDKIDLIKQTVAKGTTDLEFELFLHACKRTGLDPLMKQIYAIKRQDRTNGKEVMAIQTGIDGYRLIADRTGQYAGSDEPVYTLGEDLGPDVASVTIYKMVSGMRCAFSASARWPEYASGTSPMWKKMPFLMLGKCAEALALRKAFPAELSGVYLREEMDQADQPTNPVAHPVAQSQNAAKLAVAQEALRLQRQQAEPNNPRSSGTDVPPPILKAMDLTPTLTFSIACERLHLSQSVNEIAGVMNAANGLTLTKEDRATLISTKDHAIKELAKAQQ